MRYPTEISYLNWVYRAVLALSLVATAQAATIVFNSTCQSGAANDFHQSGVPGQFMESTTAGCDVKNQSSYSTIQQISSTAEIDPFIQVHGVADTQIEIQFFLSNPALPANTIIDDLYIAVGYDAVLAASVGGSGGGQPGTPTESFFGVRRTFDVNWAFKVESSSDVFGSGNVCQFPTTTYPRCNGQYRGTAYVPLIGPTRVNSSGPGGTGPNTFRLQVTTQSYNSALTDAFHTVTFAGTALPEGTTFSYPDFTDNPLGLGVVPEPSTMLLSFGAVAAIAFLYRSTPVRARRA